MTGWYTVACLIKNPSEARIMLIYLHDCQGSVKKQSKGMWSTDTILLRFVGLSTAAVSPLLWISSRAVVCLVDGTSGAQLKLFLYFLF